MISISYIIEFQGWKRLGLPQCIFLHIDPLLGGDLETNSEYSRC
jgi:hypothetical protein